MLSVCSSSSMEQAFRLPQSLEYLDWDLGSAGILDERVLNRLLDRSFLKEVSLRFETRHSNLLILRKCLIEAPFLKSLDLINNRLKCLDVP